MPYDNGVNPYMKRASNETISRGGMRDEVSVVLLLKISYDRRVTFGGRAVAGLFYWEGIAR